MSTRIPQPRASALAGIYVVETDHDRFVGRIEIAPDGTLTVRSGLRGHPAIVRTDVLVDVTPAALHPDAEVAFA